MLECEKALREEWILFGRFGRDRTAVGEEMLLQRLEIHAPLDSVLDRLPPSDRIGVPVVIADVFRSRVLVEGVLECEKALGDDLPANTTLVILVLLHLVCEEGLRLLEIGHTAPNRTHPVGHGENLHNYTYKPCPCCHFSDPVYNRTLASFRTTNRIV